MSAGNIPASTKAVAYTCASGVFPAAVRTTGTVPWTKVTHDDYRRGMGFQSDSYKVYTINQRFLIPAWNSLRKDFNVSQACCTSDLPQHMRLPVLLGVELEGFSPHWSLSRLSLPSVATELKGDRDRMGLRTDCGECWKLFLSYYCKEPQDPGMMYLPKEEQFRATEVLKITGGLAAPTEDGAVSLCSW